MRTEQEARRWLAGALATECLAIAVNERDHGTERGVAFINMAEALWMLDEEERQQLLVALDEGETYETYLRILGEDE